MEIDGEAEDIGESYEDCVRGRGGDGERGEKTDIHMNAIKDINK